MVRFSFMMCSEACTDKETKRQQQRQQQHQRREPRANLATKASIHTRPPPPQVQETNKINVRTLLSEVDHRLFGYDFECIGAASAVLDELHVSEAALAEGAEDLEVGQLEVGEEGVLVGAGGGATSTAPA